MCATIVFVCAVCPGVVSADDEAPSGEVLYREQCAECHGERGEGNKEADPGPLIGDKSIRELTQLIERTMPDGEPERCVGPDAERVARYIYETFYSEIAQSRHAPAQLEFARLTGRQYENALADIIRGADQLIHRTANAG